MEKLLRVGLTCVVMAVGIACGGDDAGPGGGAAAGLVSQDSHVAADMDSLAQILASHPETGAVQLGSAPWKWADCGSAGDFAPRTAIIGAAGNVSTPLASPNGHQLIVRPGTLSADIEFGIQDLPNGCRVLVSHAGAPIKQANGFTLRVSCLDACATALPAVFRVHPTSYDSIPAESTEAYRTAPLDELSAYALAVP